MRFPKDYSNALMIALGLADLSILDKWDRSDYEKSDPDPRKAGCIKLGELLDEQLTAFDQTKENVEKIMNHLGIR